MKTHHSSDVHSCGILNAVQNCVAYIYYLGQMQCFRTKISIPLTPLTHDTKYPVLSTGFPPMKSEGYCFGVGRLCTRLSVCLSTCPSRNIPKYLLVRFGAFSAWIDSTMDSPKCGSRGGGGAGGPDLPRKITSYIFSIGISNWNPPPRKKLAPPPLENVWPPQERWKMIVFFEINHLRL